MNLTSKRMLQFMTAVASTCALTATADVTQWVADSFEAGGPGYTNASPNMAIGTYKQLVTGDQNQYTNLAWVAAAGDASKIVSGSSTYAETRPLADTDNNQYLNLETEGQTLTRTNAAPLDFSTTPVYVDTLIKFTPSEDTPTIGNDVKIAVYVDVNNHLVVHHRVDLADFEGEGQVLTNSVFADTINTSAWYRLTIMLGKVGNQACSKILLNGVTLSNGLTYKDDLTLGGDWFMNADTGNTLSAVAFQGTGAVDELVVADDYNGHTPNAILLTLSFGDGFASVTTNGVAVTSPVVVPNNTEVAITAAPWYHLTSTTGSGLFTAGVGAYENAVATTGTVSGANEATITLGAALNVLTVSYAEADLNVSVANGGTIDATSAITIAPDAADETHYTGATGGSVTDGKIYGAHGATVVLGSALNTLNLSAGSGIVNITKDGTPVTSVTAKSTISVNAAQFKRVASTDGTFSGTLPAAIATGTVKGADGATITFTSADAPASALPSSAWGSDVSKVAAWAAANGNKTEAQIAAAGDAWLDDYLLNVAPGTDAKPEIKSIVVSETGDVTITVGATSETVNYTSLNGTLVVFTADDLGSEFALAGTYTIDSTAADLVTVTIPSGNGKFVKAIVQ